ncbi:hypothetical protein [Microbacterium paraoxydans]|uniref:Uncharacterized protein n=1 Tax=Microbacterium paraoxydans TaxID=199592 RepID=A0ABS5IQH4_9MICO|nr:hypothetical protein [Microbacterium paraoxydans]MBS0024492.1 hypothetical protein [Microbacterium paraoxydans]
MSPSTLDYPVEEASVDDVRVAAQAALDRAGVTEAELRDQARAGDFHSLSARLAWVIVSALDPASTI